MTFSPKTILLFDMDGVLLQAGGYHRGLQDTVAIIARSLGFPQVALSQEEIHFFESVGVTSEWDSSAICTALLLRAAWQAAPALHLPENPFQQVLAPLRVSPPDFRGFFQELAQVFHPSASPLAVTEQLLLHRDRNGYSFEQALILQSVLRNARRIEGSLTHRLFQEMILGSPVFEEIYTLPPFMHVGSYLAQYDRPLLSRADQAALRAWLAQPGQAAAIFTNRPSQAPGDFFSTPEAEIGARTAGLEGVPILGFGALAWLADQHGVDHQAYLKPSPVHVLAALWLASQPAAPEVDGERRLRSALEAAAQVAAGSGAAQWQALRGAHVFVFEDAVRGLLGAGAAQQALQRLQVPIQVQLNGISDSPPKQQALARVGAAVYSTLRSALVDLGVFEG